MLFPPLLLCLIGLSSLALARVAYRHHTTPGAIALVVLNISVTIWSLAYATELVLNDLSVKLVFTKVAYIGIASAPIAWLVFAVRYTQRALWLNRHTLALLGSVPITTIVLAWTNELHGFLWTEVRVVTDPFWSAVVVDYGPWFIVHIIFSYSALFVGTIILVQALIRGDVTQQLQLLVLFIGVLVPWVANALHLLGITPIYPLDITPFTLSLSEFCFALGFLRLQFLDVLPIAYTSVVTTMSDGVIVFDTFGRTISLNPSAAQLLGLRSSVVVGRPAREVLASLPEVARQVKTEQRISLESTHVFNGQRRYLTIEISPLFRGEQITGHLVFLHDISAPREAAARQQSLASASAILAASLEYKTTLETIASLTVPHLADICTIHLLNPDGTLQRASLTAVDPHLQQLVEELDDQHPMPLDAPYSYPLVIQTGEPWLYRSTDGPEFATVTMEPARLALLNAIGISSSISVPLIARHRILGALSLATCTGRRLYEQDDVDLAADLARRAALAVENAILVANLRISEVRAREANEAAEAANKAKSTFIAHVSHEIRTPLTGVIGITDILLDADLSSWQRRLAEMLRSSGETLMVVINDILDLEKMEAGKLELTSEPVDLVECVEEVLDLVAIHAAQKRLDLSYSINAGTPQVVFGDYNRLRQILLNLVSNAIKFTPQGSVNIQINSGSSQAIDTATREQESLHMLHFAVRDTGIGIAADDLPRLFQSFNQVNSTVSRNALGTGLGLAICKHLCGLMGGQIGVTSEVGHGSTFYFSIPVPPVQGATPLVPLSRQDVLVDRRLLVIAPDVTSRSELVTQALTWGMQVTSITPGEFTQLSATSTRHDDLIIAYDYESPEVIHEQLHVVSQAQRILLLPITSEVINLYTDNYDIHVLSLPIRYSRIFALLRHLSQEKSAVQVERMLPSTTLPTTEQPLRVLLVEDDPVSQVVSLHMLTQLGLITTVTGNGTQALVELSQRQHDVVLLDVQLPDMSGTTIAEIVREQHHLKRPYLVAFTALSFLDRQSIHAVMDDYLGKPINRTALVSVVARARAWHLRQHQENSLTVLQVTELRSMLDDKRFEQLVKAYLSNTPIQLVELHTALTTGDGQSMRRILHQLKSSSAIFQARVLVKLCEELEDLAETDEGFELPEHLKRIESEYAKVQQALQRMIISLE